MLVIGIDPGLTGGLAAINSRTGECTVHDLPTTPLEGNGMVKRRIQGLEFGMIVRKYIALGEGMAVYLEQVGAMGGKDNAIQTQASLAGTFLGIRCVLDVLRIKPVLVSPQRWKATFGLKRQKDEKDSAYKGRHLTLARTLYPAADLTLAKHHNRAEAVLIAHAGLKDVA